jgi:hypothetical protein
MVKVVEAPTAPREPNRVVVPFWEWRCGTGHTLNHVTHHGVGLIGSEQVGANRRTGRMWYGRVEADPVVRFEV